MYTPEAPQHAHFSTHKFVLHSTLCMLCMLHLLCDSREVHLPDAQQLVHVAAAAALPPLRAAAHTAAVDSCVLLSGMLDAALRSRPLPNSGTGDVSAVERQYKQHEHYKQARSALTWQGWNQVRAGQTLYTAQAGQDQ